MTSSSHSGLPSPDDWEWFKSLLEHLESSSAESSPEDSLPTNRPSRADQIAWIIEQTRIHRPGMMPFVKRHVADMLESSTRLLSQPSSRQFDPDLTGRLFDTGDRIGDRYTVTRFLGQGGMGEVYQVDDSELQGRSVALKTIRGDLAGSKDADFRFEREVRAALCVAHPNVCRIYDVGRHRSGDTERLFLTMELLLGSPLSERVRPSPALKSTPALPKEDDSNKTNPETTATVTSNSAVALANVKMPQAEALKIIRQLAAGLAAIHSEGIVHRDFKPANVMLVPEVDGSCRAVIMDFGLARVMDLELESSVTQIGARPGTPAYMAPEQLYASAPTTFASDVYSLGVTMHEILTGRRYDYNGTFKALNRSGISAWLRDVVTRCLDSDLTKRFGNAAEVVTALDDRTRNRFAPHSRSIVVGASLFLIALIGLGVALSRQSSAPPPRATRAYLQGLDDLHSAAPFLATTRLRDALRIDPHYGAASARLAQAWIDMEAVGRARDAILVASSLEAAKSFDEPTRILCEAVRLSVLGEHTKAIPLFERLVAAATEEDKTNAQIDLAWELSRANETARALKLWQALASVSPYAALRAAVGDQAEVERRLSQARVGFEIAHNNMEGESQVLFTQAMKLPTAQADEAIALLRKVADRAQMSHDLYQEARAHLQIAFAELEKFQPALAEEEALKAMQIARRGDVEMTLGNATRALGTAALENGDRVKAEQYFADSVRLARENRDPAGEAAGLHLLADIHNRMGEPELGEKEANHAFEYYSHGGSNDFAIKSANALTISRREQGKFDLAEQSVAAARKLFQEKPGLDLALLGQIEEAHGQLERVRGRFPSAVAHMRAALEANTAAKHRVGLTSDPLLLAEDLAMAGDLVGAKAVLSKLDGDARVRTDVAVRQMFIEFYSSPHHVPTQKVTSLLEIVEDPEDRAELQIILLASEFSRRDLKQATRTLDGPMSKQDPYLRRESKLNVRLARGQGLAALGRNNEALRALGSYDDFASHAVLSWRAALLLSHLTESAESAAWKEKALRAFRNFQADYKEEDTKQFLKNRHDLTAEWTEIEHQK